MLDNCVNYVDELFGGFHRNVDWEVLLSTYWFLFLVELPRYYILEIVIVIHHSLTYRKRSKRYEE